VVVAVLGVLDLGVDDAEELGVGAGPRRGRRRERHRAGLRPRRGGGEGPEQGAAALGPRGGGGAEDEGCGGCHGTAGGGEEGHGERSGGV
jgi:hypothetical protein